MRNLLLVGLLGFAAIGVVAGQSQPANEALWEAARAGDTARITAALAQGADVNAKSRYDVTRADLRGEQRPARGGEAAGRARRRRQRAGHASTARAPPRWR